MKIICLYGQPGCGKTTQADLLVSRFGFSKFGMGERLRAEIASGSELGQQIKPHVDAGTLIPDVLMSEIIKEAGQTAGVTGLIFDGFPRIISQAKMLDSLTQELDWQIEAFIHLKLSPEQALARIKARLEAGGGRDDDADESAIKNRFAVFEAQSVSLLNFYRDRGKLIEIDGALSISDTNEAIISALQL